MEKVINIECKKINFQYNTQNDSFSVKTQNKIWHSDTYVKPYFIIKENNKTYTIYFEQAMTKRYDSYKTGIATGIKITYENFIIDNKILPISFEASIWFETANAQLHFDIQEMKSLANIEFVKMMWPVPFEFNEKNNQNYSLIPMMQGILVPNNYEKDIKIVPPPSTSPIVFYERAAYMAWYAQVSHRNGYLAIINTPIDAGYELNHKAGDTTKLNVLWYGTMKKFSYKRSIIFIFLDDCDYNDICKTYRKHIKEQGKLVTLKEKVVRNPKLKKLIGCPVIHTDILSEVAKGSAYYDNEHPENNYSLTSFNERKNQLLKLKEKGLKKAYMHLDGWGKNGYDHSHPDILPPCEKAGGTKDMISLIDTCKNNDILFAIHDQYRDYYVDAETFDENQALCTITGKPEYENTWAGGNQTHLCSMLAPYYVKRNFNKLKKLGIELDGAYLDVFAVIALEECYSKEHPMTRAECMQKRIECFNYVKSQDMIISSEEPVEWAIPYLDLVHHAPFALTPNFDKGEVRGYAVPLFNLVYHDCIITPWATTVGGWGIADNDDGFLYALLYGGTGYLDIDADKEEIERISILCNLHEKIADFEMVKHEFIDGNYRQQRAYYSNGTIVEVDFDKRTYNITE